MWFNNYGDRKMKKQSGRLISWAIVGLALMAAIPAWAAAPTANPVSATAVQGGTVHITLTGSDAETGYYDLEHIITSQPSLGTVEYRYLINYPRYSRDVSYTPTNGTGVDTFRYKVRDEEGLESSEATVTVTVLSNAAPTVNDVSARVDDGVIQIVIELDGSDDHTDSDDLVYSIVDPPAHGSFDGGTYYRQYYTLDPEFSGVVTFSYQATDEQGLTSGTATGTITINTNTAPIAHNQSLEVFANVTSETVQLSFTDPDVQTMTFEILSLPLHGEIVNLSTTSGTFKYAPTADYVGADSFTWRVYDGVAYSEPAQVDLFVRQGGDPDGMTVAIIVQGNLYPELSNEVQQLAADLDDEGWTPLVKVWGSGGVEDMWNYLHSVYTNETARLSGALLLGYNLPYPADGDICYWDMTTFNQNNVQQPDDIWVSRFASYDMRELQLALDANHYYRTGQSRLPCDAWRCLNSGYTHNANYLAAFLDVWDGATDWPDGHIETPMRQGSEVIYRSDHGSPATGTGPHQGRFGFISGCYAGEIHGSVAKYQYTAFGANLMSCSSHYVTYFGYFSIDKALYNNDWLAVHLNAGESWGPVLLRLPHNANFRLPGFMYYGDLSLGAKMTPANQLPQISGLSRNVSQPAPGEPVTFSVAFTDPDADQHDSPHVDFEYQTHWYMNGYTKTGYPDNSLSDTNQLTHTFDASGVYNLRVMVMDEWRAVAWIEQSVTVNAAPVAVNDTAVVQAGNEVAIPVLDNDVEPDGEMLSLDVIVTSPGHGTVEIVGNLAVYTATNSSWTGTDTFVYRVRDPGGKTATATVEVTVQVDDEPPFMTALSSISDSNKVLVVFNEKVMSGNGAQGAENASNYALDHGVTISAATLQADGGSVILTVTPLVTNTLYMLSAQNIADIKGNAMPQPQQVQFEYMGLLPGLYYQYYEGTYSSGLPDFGTLTPVSVGTVPTFDISVRERDDSFALRFTGCLFVETAGDYTFYTSSDDGDKLYVGNVLVVDNDGPHGTQERSGTISLQAGLHDMESTYFEVAGGQLLTVSWSGPGIAKQTIPTEVLWRRTVMDPGGRALAPSALSALAFSTSRIKLSWMDNADNESGFKVERSLSGSGDWSQIATLDANVWNYTDTGLSASTRYYYRVRAWNDKGDTSYSSLADATTQAPPPSFAGNYSHKMKITFAGYDRDSTLEYFPVLVMLDSSIPNFSYDGFTSPVAADLRFASSDGATELNYEIEKWDVNGTSYIWVQVPELSQGSHIWMFWGNAANTAPPAYTASGATWSEGFAGVWHLGDSNRDSTSYGNNGAAGGVVVAGRVGVGRQLDGTAGINVGNHTSLNLAGSPLTISAFIKRNTATEQGMVFGAYKPPSSTMQGYGYLTGWGETPTRQRYWHGGPQWCGPSTSDIGTEVWRYVAVSANGTTAHFRLDGQADGSVNAGLPNSYTGDKYIGSVGTSTRFRGVIDELRVSSVARSADWLWAEYMTMASNGLFTGYEYVVSGNPQRQLQVVSAHGTPVPAVGTHVYTDGAVITNTVDAAVIHGSTQYVNSGWSMSGCAPCLGTGSSVVMTVTNDAVLTWHWQTNFWLAVSAGAGGTVDAEAGWRLSGSNVMLTAQPEQYYAFTNWVGDVDAGDRFSNQLALEMSEPKSFEARFIEQVTADTATPHWWLAAYTNSTYRTFQEAAQSDRLGKGMKLWQEFIAGTDPGDAEDRFVLDALDGAATHRLVFRGRLGRVYNVYYNQDLTSNTWQILGTYSNLPGAGEDIQVEDSALDVQRFYRVGVQRE